MPRISIRQNTELFVSIAPDEVSNLSNKDEYTSFRFSLANVKFPEQDVLGTLPESIPVGAGYLGDIDFNIVAKFNQFEEVGDFNFTVKNKSLVEQRTIDYPTTFRPCDLDVDGDGFITNEDIDTIFSQPKIPRKFDINGDGVVNDADRNLAREYVGTICNTVGDPDAVNEYEGVYDRVPVSFAYSVNRLLKGSHSDKPLFRVIMAVDGYNPGFNPAVPGAQNFVAPGHFWNRDDVVYTNGSLVEMWNYSFDTVDGQLLVKDIFWGGDEQSIEDQLTAFWQQGLSIRESYGINTDPDYYTYYPLRQTIGGIYVPMVYDQSDNNKHFRGYDRSNVYNLGQPENVGKCSVGYCPIISVWGNAVRGENGRISLAPPWGDNGVDANPFNIPDGVSSNNASYQGLLSYTMLDQTQSPTTPYNEDFFAYCISDVAWKRKAAPFDNVTPEDTFDVYDALNHAATSIGYQDFADIWNADGTMKQDFYDMYAAANTEVSPYGTPRAIFWLMIMGLGGTSKTAWDAVGQYFRPFAEPYPAYIIGNSNAVVTYSDYINPTINPATGAGVGLKDIYWRAPGYPNNQNHNISVGSNTFRNGQVLVMSVRSHQDNLNPPETVGIDIRLNNKKQTYHGGNSDNGINNDRLGTFAAKKITNIHGRMFYEMVGFPYTDEESYESIMTSVNEYFQTEELPDASITPQPI